MLYIDDQAKHYNVKASALLYITSRTLKGTEFSTHNVPEVHRNHLYFVELGSNNIVGMGLAACICVLINVV